MSTVKTIRILPQEYLNKIPSSFPDLFDSNNSISSQIPDKCFFTSSAKSAFRIIAEMYSLQRSEEVFISTTSDSTFVSSCVTSTFFNYSTVSRVLTSRTKLIVIIHEFGFPNPQTEKLVQVGMQRNIPVIQDKAHFIDFERDTFVGDFTIHSLPKSFPVSEGGILIDHNGVIDEKNVVNKYLSNNSDLKSLNFSLLLHINKRRKYLYELYSSALSVSEVFANNEGAIPFCFGFELKFNSEDVIEAISTSTELLANYVEKQILIPLNPFAHEFEHKALIDQIKQRSIE